MHPVGDAAAEPVTIPQPLLPRGPNFEQGRGTFLHDAADVGKAVVGVLDDMRECDRFRHELLRCLAGRLEHHQGAAGGRFGGQDEGGTRQAIEEEHRRIGECRPDPLHRVDRNRLEGRQPFAAMRARPAEAVSGPTIRPTSDFLDDDGGIDGGGAGCPIEVNAPPRHVRTDGLGGRIAVHARDRIGIPSEPSQNGQHIPASPACPGTNGRLGADDHIKSYQARPEDLGFCGRGHWAVPSCVDSVGRGWG